MSSFRTFPSMSTLTPSQRALLEDRIRGGPTRAGSQNTIPKTGAEEAPLSTEQEPLWALESFAPGEGALNIFFVLHIKGLLQKGALEHALSEAVSRHSSLRSRICVVAGV